jgi:hypothetical protein
MSQLSALNLIAGYIPPTASFPTAPPALFTSLRSHQLKLAYEPSRIDHVHFKVVHTKLVKVPNQAFDLCTIRNVKLKSGDLDFFGCSLLALLRDFIDSRLAPGEEDEVDIRFGKENGC